MNLSVGIVGLPNVGKSTLFNALLKKQQALAANYPFATIDPNIGIVAVPDSRLEKLAEVTKIEEKLEKLPPLRPATVEFVDIAGLVKGASEGAGLGNKFLSHIREVQLIAHVVRVFEDADVIREGSVGPKEDYQTIQTELILADLQTLTKVADNRKEAPAKIEAIKKLIAGLNVGKRAYDVILSDEERKAMQDLLLLTNKKEVIVLNIAEKDYSDTNIPAVIKSYSQALELPTSSFVVICAKVESELSVLSDDEQKQYLKELGVAVSGLEQLIGKAYEQLGLISFLTTGEIESRAWTITKGTLALQAAGVIHTDFESKFIKADIVPYQIFIDTGGWTKAREEGKVAIVGRDYEMKDGDVVEFKIGT